MPYAAPISLPTTMYVHLRSLVLKRTKPDGGETALPGEGGNEKRRGKRILTSHFSPHFSSDFRVESGTKSSPLVMTFWSPAASLFVGEREKKSRWPETI